MRNLIKSIVSLSPLKSQQITSNVGKLFQFILSNIFISCSYNALIPHRFSKYLRDLHSGIGIASLSFAVEHNYE